MMIMRIRNSAWQFFIVCFAITAVSLWCTTWYSVHLFKKQFLQTTIDDVHVRTGLLKRDILPLVNNPADYPAVDSLCKKSGPIVAARITVVLPSGKVIGESDGNPDSMENHANRPEVIQALTGATGIQQRFSATLRRNMLYVAEPVGTGDSIKAVLRLAVSLQSINDHERRFYFSVILVSLLTLILLVSASFLIARRLGRPILQMKIGAQRFASGELDFKLTVPPGEELGGLAQALNTMASTLDDRIRTITRQRNELNAILNSMAEGVIAVDNQERIISMNPAAARILGVTDQSFKGKWLHEIVRNSNLQKFLSHTLSADTMIETTFVFPGADGDRYLQASGTVLNNGPKDPEGAVLVLNDITRLRRLENVRKEFVANVSHELRTPLTSIKGFVETIRGGDYQLDEEVNQFLKIISDKTDRLCSIVDDILTLSSIERDNEFREIGFSVAKVKTVLEDAIKTCAVKAREKNIAIGLTCGESLHVPMNAPLLEQAVVNLIDNAIKYSEPGKPVAISAMLAEGESVITVVDQGIGIPVEHLSRLFERFYRVDKARSRKVGGTGLGLSIVKNIAVAHNGRVTVESEPGKGSTFTIHLPISNDK
jgi:two-component system phosphate regulon sensor histidine kinase PhoR